MVSVIFRSRLHPEGEEEYTELAPRILELAEGMPGFVSFERFTADDGERLALVTFESLEELEAWRRHPEHLAAQQRGRERLYAEYKIVVAEHVRSYSFDGEHRITYLGE
jgi:heme-degrading monooxygenase HmoA